MITLVTGTPGAGKTLFMVKMLVEDLIKGDRQIYTDIAGLNIVSDNLHVFTEEMTIDKVIDGETVTVDHPLAKLPLHWFEGVADGAIFIFDEVQRYYPPRNTMSKVPKFIQQYETHRHKGFDFYFITQGPRLLDRHLMDLVGFHIHLYRPFGMKRSVIYEWNAVNLQPNPSQTKNTAIKKTFVFPKRIFKLYKSATVHTVKLRLPWKVIAFLTFAFSFLGYGSWGIYKRYNSPPDAETEIVYEQIPDGRGGFIDAKCSGYVSGIQSGGYLLSFMGRVFIVDYSTINKIGIYNVYTDSVGDRYVVCGV